MSMFKKYEIIILLKEEFNHNELKSWVFNFAKNLKKCNVSNLSVISRGKQNLSYPLKNKLKGNYIQLNFSTMPQYIKNFDNFLKLDPNILRFLIFNV